VSLTGQNPPECRRLSHTGKSHRRDRTGWLIEEAIEARGARPIFLPAYSPDLNPIEQLFARLKSFLRKLKARTVEELWRAIASFLKGVSKEDCKAYLANSGYT